MVHAVPVPALEDVDLAILRPRERRRGQQPERGPDAGRAGGFQRRAEAAAGAAELLVRDEARRGVGVGGERGVDDGAEDELVGGCGEAVFGRGGVVLGFVVAPAVGAGFLLEELGDGDRGVEGRLPVGGTLRCGGGTCGGGNWRCACTGGSGGTGYWRRGEVVVFWGWWAELLLWWVVLILGLGSVILRLIVTLRWLIVALMWLVPGV